MHIAYNWKSVQISCEMHLQCHLLAQSDRKLTIQKKQLTKKLKEILLNSFHIYMEMYIKNLLLFSDFFSMSAILSLLTHLTHFFFIIIVCFFDYFFILKPNIVIQDHSLLETQFLLGIYGNNTVRIQNSVLISIQESQVCSEPT